MSILNSRQAREDYITKLETITESQAAEIELLTQKIERLRGVLLNTHAALGGCFETRELQKFIRDNIDPKGEA